MKKLLLLFLCLFLVACENKIVSDSSYIYLTDPTKEVDYNDYIKEVLNDNEKITLIESFDEADYLQKLKDLADDPVELIISTESLVKNARDNGINFKKEKIACLSNQFVTKYLNENIMQVTYKTNNAGFLAGIAAGFYASSNGKRQVGYVITDDSEVNNKLLAGFEDGVWQEFPECTIYVANTMNGEHIHSIIGKMIDNGVQIVFTNSSFGNLSVIDEITKRKENGENIFSITYDDFPRISGYYSKTINSSNNDEVEVEEKNSIYFRVYDDFVSSIDYILRHYNYDKFLNPISSASEACFITEVLNNGDNINQDILEEKISLYKELINKQEIIVRSSPSNPNAESRVKIVE